MSKSLSHTRLQTQELSVGWMARTNGAEADKQ